MKEAEHLLELLVKYSDPNCEEVRLLVRAGSCKVPIFVEQVCVISIVIDTQGHACLHRSTNK